MDLSEAYVWLDKIKRDLIADVSNPQRIEALEIAQMLIRESITGEAE